MRKISGCFIVLCFLVAAGCLTEVKPLLKPVDLDVPTRIANMQKWLDQAVASKELTRNAIKPIQAKLYQIKEKYNMVEQPGGGLRVKDAETLNRMLDECSNILFQAREKKLNK